MKKIIKNIILSIIIQYYMKILRKVKDDYSTSNCLYDLSLVSHDKTHDNHIYHFPDNIDISIWYSIPTIRKIINEKIEYVSFEELNKKLQYDIKQSKEEFDNIRTLVIHKIKHNSESLIVMYHIPTGKWLLLDGRHRFVEYEKFNPKEKHIPILLVDSEMILNAIINKNGFIAYCILYNVYIFQNYPVKIWKKKLRKIHSLL